MKAFRVLITLGVLFAAYVAEISAKSEAAALVWADKIYNTQLYMQLQERQREINTIVVIVPLLATILILAIWWEPIKQLWKGSL